MNMDNLLNLAKDKTLICFEAGQRLERVCESFADISFFEKIDFIADNNDKKHMFCFEGREKPVFSIENCLWLAKKEPVLLFIDTDCFINIIEQLDAMSELNDCCCFLYSFVRDFIEPYQLPINRAETESLKIPKIIHYCWFGGKPMRDDFKVYIETWKKFCPDYEIVCWDESNYDYKQNEYMYQAYKHGKWGFVPDFARLDIICRFGGVYLDTDVELIKNIDDLLCDEAFCGFEDRDSTNNGSGFGAVAGFPIIKEQLKIYDMLSFVNKDGSFNFTPGPYYQTRKLIEFGLKRNNSLQKINGMKIYPSDVLSPMSFSTRQTNITSNTYSIHHYSMTWKEDLWHINRNLRYQKLKSLKGILEQFFQI